MSVKANIAIHFGRLYRFKKAVVKVVEVNLPKVKVEFWSGKRIWIHGDILSDY